ncbi:MAG: SDR family oxidoreductase [Marinifilaceae bacterium]
MQVQIENQLFIVCGATSGFGLSTLETLVENGAKVIAVARGREKLDKLRTQHPLQVEYICGDITHPDTQVKLTEQINDRKLSGILINAGGPPALKFMETQKEDWDQAYRNLLRWKVALVKTLVPLMEKEKYGRFVFIESSAVKQPIPNLVLSTSLRLAVVGFVKTVSQEMAQSGITFNILAPGYHETPAINRLLDKKAEQERITPDLAKNKITQTLPMGRMGNPDDLGKLAVWLLSPNSGYITGQTISIDGGQILGVFG